MKKIILIQPLGELNHTNGFTRTSEQEPLALEYLQATLEQIDVISTLYYGRIDEDKLLHELLSNPVVAVCFSIYSYQYPYCLKLAEKIKILFENKNKVAPTIIFGGYHPSAMPEKVIAEKQVDIVIKGEGEIILRDVIDTIIKKENLAGVNGIWYKDINGIVQKTKEAERIKEIDTIPFPKRHSEFMSSSRQFQITYPAPSQQKGVAQVLYSRGCPYSCIFCSSESMWGKKVFWRNPEKVLDEIEFLHNEYNTNLVFFPDLTFNLNKKKVYEICNEFIKRNLPIHWWGLFRLDNLDNEMLFMLKEAKCVKLSIGFESDDASSDKLKGNFSISKDDYAEVLYTANAIGLIIKALLIIGFPDDTEEKIRNYNNFLRSIPVDEIRVSFITPFPGTQVWDEYQNNYLSKNFNLNELTTEIPIINHPRFSKEELFDLRLEVVQNFYLDPIYKKRILDKIYKYPHLKKSYFEYFKFLENKKIINDNQLTNIF
ncbi:MAG: B12-binding domain-containing radical SAM protein [Bacteroidales bacterium]|jgi:radical SAM superfamily enzyme YgiQ (UPF0313 family)|nr:B12-binding domain-containing radical SAM protein [Bacteroidales bacterium]